MNNDTSFWAIKFIDLFAPLLTIVALLIAYFQLTDVRKQKKIEFTYSLYRDFFNYLNNKENRDVKNWLFGIETSEIDKIKIGDLLEHFEALWSLKKQKMIDIGIAYDLFGYYIVKASKAVNPTADEYINELKILEQQNLVFRDDLFEGFQSILLDMQDREYFKYRRNIPKK